MEYAFLAYVGFTLVSVPIFRVEGCFGLDYAKDQLFTVLTGLMVVAMMFHGKLFYSANPWMLAFMGLATASLFWSDHQHLARREVVRLLAIFAFVGVASQVPRDLLLFSCFMPAPVIAAYGIVQQVWSRDFCDPRFELTLTKRTRFQTWFGNSNYSAAYLAPQVFVGMWLAVHWHWAFWFGTCIVLIGIGVSQCRAAQLAVIVGLSLLFPLGIPVLLLVGIALYKLYPGCMESIGHRFLMVRACIEIWKRWPVFGAGPRCFRHKHSRATAELNLRDETILGRPGKPGRYRFTVGRRAHNDYAETLAEYGLVGFIVAGGMFGTFLWGLSADWILLCGAVAFLVNAGLFLNFRDTAVSLPFWTIIATTGGTMLSVPLPVAVGAGAVVLYLLYTYTYKPFMANWWGDRGKLLEALKLQPFATEYLYRIATMALQKGQYPLAYNCAEKALYHYDGERPEWAVLHTYGQIALVNGAWMVAREAFRQALMINPTEPHILDSMRQIRDVERMMREPERKAA